MLSKAAAALLMKKAGVIAVQELGKGITIGGIAAGGTALVGSVMHEKDANEGIALHVGLAATLGELGREADAKKLDAEILRREPGFSTKTYVAGLSYRDPAESTRFEISLREAGLPE